MTESAACPECGYPIEGAETSCPNCGIPLEPAVSRSDETAPPAHEPDTSSSGEAEPAGSGAPESMDAEDENEGAETGFFCTNCGTRNPAGANFCYKCGTSLKTTGAPPRPRKSRTKKVGGKQKKASTRKRGGVAEKKSASLSPNMLYGGFAVIALIVLALIYTNRHSPEEHTHANEPAVSLQALDQARQAMESDPGNPAAVLHYANKLFDAGMFQQAIEMYKKYLAQRPEDSNARIDMGVSYFQLGQNENAISVMEEALKYDPKHQKGHYNLGIVNINLGNVEKAREWFQKAIDLDPKSDVAKMARKQLDDLNQG